MSDETECGQQVRSNDSLGGTREMALARWDRFSTSNDGGETFEVLDCEGDYMFTVTKDISERDLLALLRYGDRMFRLGKDVGAREVKSGLRAFIGAAPLNPLE